LYCILIPSVTCRVAAEEQRLNLINENTANEEYVITGAGSISVMSVSDEGKAA